MVQALYPRLIGEARSSRLLLLNKIDLITNDVHKNFTMCSASALSRYCCSVAPMALREMATTASQPRTKLTMPRLQKRSAV